MFAANHLSQRGHGSMRMMVGKVKRVITRRSDRHRTTGSNFGAAATAREAHILLQV